MDKTPIYKYPANYAREKGELELYRASLAAHAACKCAIDDAILDGWDGMNFVPGTARKVLGQFGPERVFFVLAYTVRERKGDTRITGHNQSWAKTIPLYGLQRGRGSCTLESHSTKVDLFIDMAQKEYLLSLPSGRTSRRRRKESWRSFRTPTSQTAPTEPITWPKCPRTFWHGPTRKIRTGSWLCCPFRP